MRRQYVRPLIFALWTLMGLALSVGRVRADDGIFPPAPAAKAFIDFDGRGFLIRGKRTFLASGSLHYSRVPRALWRDRLLRFKRLGFNTVETYAFWNFHEPQEGKWDFSGDKDLDAFLKLIKQLGMFAVVRVGPYVCAEWDSGGYPVWLRFKPGLRVREDEAQFVAAVDQWYEKVLPIVAANQIHRGGAVVMVQLENEHPLAWGKEMPNPYFTHLRAKALALGLEVPYFFSGLHHGSDPAGDTPWDSKDRVNPWYTTEFWPGWYDLYGPLPAERLRYFDRGTWKILAYGGNGYNFYMLHGGTDFDTWNDDEVASSYDYGAAVGQAGDIRPIGYRFKRANLFARSFADILENSVNATDAYRNNVIPMVLDIERSNATKQIRLFKAAPADTLRVTARESQAGAILFLDNRQEQTTGALVKWKGTDLPSVGSLPLAPGEIVPIVENYRLLPEVTLDIAMARLLGVVKQDDTTTLVAYGPPNSPAELRFSVPAGGVKVVKGGAAFSRVPKDPKQLALKFVFSAVGPQAYTFAVGGKKVRVLALSETLADKTWFVEAGGKNLIVCGPNYLGEVEAGGNHLRLTSEQAVNDLALTETWVYGEDDTPEKRTLRPANAATAFAAPALQSWEMRRADAEARPDYHDAEWKAGEQPLPMGADGDISAYAWYRTTVRAPKAGTYTLRFSDAGDWITAFVNGQRAAGSTVRQRFSKPVERALTVPLKEGENTLAVFAAHYGRHKLFNYLGPIDTIDAKGVSGPVTLVEGASQTAAVTKWRWAEDTRQEHATPDAFPSGVTPIGQETKEAAPSQDVFRNRRGFVWYVTTLPELPGPHRRLAFENVDDNATVYLNGKKVGDHKGWGEAFTVSLDSAWNPNGPNELAVLVENTNGPGGIMGAVELESVSEGENRPLTGWKMRGGIGDPQRGDTPWQPFPGTQGASVPAFYRATFTYAPSSNGLHLILRVGLTGLTRGFVWLNGHNLGRYPEKVPVNGLYLPECWLTPGANTLTIFDEEGHAPTQVRLNVEEAASRFVTELNR